MKFHSLVIALVVFTCVIYHGLGRSSDSGVPRSLSERIRQHSALKKIARFLPLVRHFSVSQKNAVESSSKSIQNPLSSVLFRGAPMNTNQVSLSNKSAAPFKWESCGPPQQIMELKAFSVTPEPLHFPGTVTLSFDIAFHDTISEDDNVTVALQVYAKVSGTWILIPCIGPVGSCAYVDFCQLIQQNTCPQQFKAEGVPCKCPFKKGEYHLSTFPIKIDAAVLIHDDYKATMRVSSGTKGPIACYQISLSVD